MRIQTVAVIGAGVMGQGIAQACAAAGYKVTLFDANPVQPRLAMGRIAESLTSAVTKGKLTQAAHDMIFSRISTVSSVDLVTGDLIIEAIVEDLQLKKELFTLLEKKNANSILATNTSTFPVAKIADALHRPDKCIGLHFFNPAPVMKLVEVIVGEKTSPEVKSTCMDFAKSLGKSPVLVNDTPGFIVNRVARAYYLESLCVLGEGDCPSEAIDALMRSTGFRMGPFELMDLIGIDTNLAVTNSLYEAFNKPERFRPSSIQQEMVKKGWLGVKTSKGFYDYPR